MNLTEYELSRAIRFFEIKPSRGQVLYGAGLVKALQERYGFVQVPTTVAQFNLASGIEFFHGYFQGRVVIDRFQIFNNGILVEGKCDTNDCDAFIDDVFGWASSSAGLSITPNSALGTPYLSQIVVGSDIDLSGYFRQLSEFSSAMSAKVASYGLIDTPAEVAAFHLATDPAVNGSWAYRFERRSGAPYAEKKFFSSAPLKTADHLEMLDKLEMTVRLSANALKQPS